MTHDVTAPVTGSPTRQEALAWDAADPLARFRDRYLPLDEHVVAYLDGNSLGRPLASIGTAWDAAMQQWSGRLIRGWSEGWLELPGTVGDELGAAALGAAPGQVVVADSTTVLLYKCVRAALNLRPGRTRVVLDGEDFPTDRYVVASLARDLGLDLVWLRAQAAHGLTAEDVAAAVDERTAAVVLSHVDYRSGALADAAAITAAAHAAGALTVWDCSHSVGVCPLELDAWRVDLAVGCTYKFVGAGPGAPAFAYVAARHHETLDQPVWGWLGRRDAFDMEQGYVPAAGITRMLSGTPPVLGLLAVREGAALIAEAGLPAIRAKSVALTEAAVALTDEWLIPAGFTLISPRDSDRRGGHVSIARADARRVCARLVDRGVLPDFRRPDVLRLGLSPLPGSRTELWDAMAVLRAVAHDS